MAKRIKAVIVGCGNRAVNYCKVSDELGDPYEIIACVDINEKALEFMQKTYGVPKEMCFTDYRDLVKLGKIGDIMINGTMDQFHYETTLPFLELGYHVLLEKPITNNPNELYHLVDVARQNQVHLIACHVLRYSSFYRKAKEILNSGILGEIVHIEAREIPGVLLTDYSYLRGQWRNTEVSGTSFLLTKACHDVDIVCWLNNTTKPKYVASFGGRRFIVPKKAPEGAKDNCFLCPLSETCMYSTIYNTVNIRRIWNILHEDGEEAEIERIKNDPTRNICVYKTDANLADNQILMIDFEDGGTGSLTLLSSGIPEQRDLFVKGTQGELEGRLDQGKLALRKYVLKTASYTEDIIDVNDENGSSSHFGGDIGLIKDFNALIRGQETSFSISPVEDTLSSYLLIYGADKAMENRTIEEIKYRD